MNENMYVKLWRENKNYLSLIPAIVFLAVSMVFFIVGLRFENPVMLFGYDMSTLIAVSLSVSNTIIQIIGNEREKEGMGLALHAGWLGSYLLGIGTNIYGILQIITMQNSYLELIVAVSLGSMIEVLPEKLFVQFLEGFSSHRKSKESNKGNNNQQHNNQGNQNKHIPYIPNQQQNQKPRQLNQNIFEALNNKK